jgi:hypothetical protein
MPPAHPKDPLIEPLFVPSPRISRHTLAQNQSSIWPYSVPLSGIRLCKKHKNNQLSGANNQSPCPAVDGEYNGPKSPPMEA